MRVRSNGLILTVHEHPKSNRVLILLEVFGNSRFELEIWFVLQDAEGREICGRPVLLVEGCQIEALVRLEGLIRNDLGGQEQMLLVSFPLLRLLQPALLV